MPNKPGGFERHRLAAGIGAADDQLPLRVVQSQRQRNDRCLPRPQTLFEQRVPRLGELQHRRRRVGKPRTYALELGGKTSPGLQTVDLGQNRRALGDRMGLHPNLSRHRQKNPTGLSLFFLDQPHQLVVLLNGLERLQVNRLPAGGSAMHHARQCAAYAPT